MFNSLASGYNRRCEGDDFRQLMISLSIWGKQQMNDDEDKVSPLIVEPEADAKLGELIKYNKFLREYINYSE